MTYACYFSICVLVLVVSEFACLLFVKFHRDFKCLSWASIFYRWRRETCCANRLPNVGVQRATCESDVEPIHASESPAGAVLPKLRFSAQPRPLWVPQNRVENVVTTCWTPIRLRSAERPGNRCNEYLQREDLEHARSDASLYVELCKEGSDVRLKGVKATLRMDAGCKTLDGNTRGAGIRSVSDTLGVFSIEETHWEGQSVKT